LRRPSTPVKADVRGDEDHQVLAAASDSDLEQPHQQVLEPMRRGRAGKPPGPHAGALGHAWPSSSVVAGVRVYFVLPHKRQAAAVSVPPDSNGPEGNQDMNAVSYRTTLRGNQGGLEIAA
jgi:hypothetical protein